VSALAEALVAAQRRSLATLEKAYVAGAIEAEPMAEAMESCGITDAVDRAFLIASLDVLKEWGVAAPTMTERVARENGEPEKMSAKQRDYLTKLAAEKGVHLRPGFEGLSKQQASDAISELQGGTYDQQQGVPF
jgi:hypothetical protein